ncbi:MAG: ribbon-helix-helix protein, CopG family [Chloroflexota bacterium]|nr:ribbon-helix-helix protein, CopG family [Chloroflexota bacterium]
MRTTITLDDDVVAIVQKMRQEEGVGLSEALNRLVRAGMAKPATRKAYRHRTAHLGIKVDVSNVGDVLELLDEA